MSAAETEDQAAEWLWRQAAGWREEDRAAFEAWLAQSAQHRAAYWRLKAAWGRAERLAALRPAAFRPVSGAASQGRLKPLLRFAAMGGAAAAVVAGVLYMWPASQETYATAVGGQAKITLADGSQVQLNTNSAIAVSMSAGRRTVTLKRGEAFFNVVHDAARPFSVLAQGHRITDLGTKFAVRTANGRLEVTLVQGRARLETVDPALQHHATDLVPGEVAVATAHSLSVANVSPSRLKDALAWQQGKLVFNHVTLADAAAQFNRYNRTRLVVGPDIASLKISGTFDAGSIDAFASMAQYALGLQTEKKEGEIVISRDTP
jgi:transmembrane sensor